MVLGEVIATVAGILGFALTSWATLLACGLLFPARAEIARHAAERQPWGMLFLGLGATAVFGTLGSALSQAPQPLVKVLGFGILGWLLALSAVGVTGLVLLLAGRLRERQPEMPEFTATSRGAAMVIGVALVPLAGWLAFAPALFCVGLGAGLRACWPRRRRVAVPERTDGNLPA